MTFTEPRDFDEVIREGEEYLSRMEQELGPSDKVSILTKEGKGFEKIAPWEPIDFPIYDIMEYDIALPLGHEPRAFKKGATMWIERTPFTDSPVINIQITEWEDI